MTRDQIDERIERKMLAKLEVFYRAEVKAKVKAAAVLTVLEGRQLPVTAAQRKRVFACANDARLDAWLRAAGTTPSVKALLAVGALPRSPVKRSRPLAPPRAGRAARSG